MKKQDWPIWLPNIEQYTWQDWIFWFAIDIAVGAILFGIWGLLT